jgi:hypothetical protein
MKFQFNISQVLRSVAFFAFGVWTLTWLRLYPHMLGFVLFLAPAAFGGAIGAIFGKTPHGVFGGLVFVVLALFLLLIGVLVVDEFNLVQ